MASTAFSLFFFLFNRKATLKMSRAGFGVAHVPKPLDDAKAPQHLLFFSSLAMLGDSISPLDTTVGFPMTEWRVDSNLLAHLVPTQQRKSDDREHHALLRAGTDPSHPLSTISLYLIPPSPGS